MIKPRTSEEAPFTAYSVVNAKAAKTIQITIVLKCNVIKSADEKFFLLKVRLIIAPRFPIAEASLGVASPKNIEPMTAKIRPTGSSSARSSRKRSAAGRQLSGGTAGPVALHL
ncbi:MAG: hypothetical protein VX103_05490 [Pseudomonadota bacterium]|nr:hypothetical protein [Pseudomonadota bacterium]